MLARGDPVAIPGRLAANRMRTRALFEEAAAISAELTRLDVQFALYKGITLTPDSTPDPALRWQVDLDFLVVKVMRRQRATR